MLYIGIDLDTSAVKLLLMDGGGNHSECGIQGVPPGIPPARLEPAGPGGLENGRAGGHPPAAAGL